MGCTGRPAVAVAGSCGGGVVTWQASSYQIANPGGTRAVVGVVFKGLGLHMVAPPSPKGRVPGYWVLTHLNSGHRIAALTGPAAQVKAVATEVAELTDWDFAGVDGYRNMDPELPKRFAEVTKRHPGMFRVGGVGHAREQASAIYSARAS